MRTNVVPRELTDGRRVDPVRGAEHRGRQAPDRVERRGRRAELLEHAQRLPVAEPDRLLLDLLRLVDRASAQPPLEEVDVRAAQRRVRRAQEGVQIRPRAAEPREAKQADQRLAVRRLVEPDV